MPPLHGPSAEVWAEQHVIGQRLFLSRRDIGRARSHETRRLRKEVRRQLRDREISFRDAVDWGYRDPRVGKITVLDAVGQVVGKTRAPGLLERVRVPGERLLRQVGPAQCDRILDALG